ncbi:hypothetical protein ACFYWY_24875 [Streptomyces sp. NPDC002870]|uniref:hypothetical protein n=1 Tax=Streptomyces sp. NPDC002870 TaxID=3364666 RepID=UPI0036A5C248
MKTSYKVQAGLALSVSVSALSASALTLLPGEPVLDNTALFAGIGFVLLLLLFLATIIRGIALDVGSGGSLSNSWLQWLALRCLPRTVQAVLVCVFAAGIAVVTAVGGGPLQASDAAHGRYFAVDTADPHRRHVEVTTSEYDDVYKHDQRSMFAIIGLLAAGAGTLTLIIGELHLTSGRRDPHSPPMGRHETAGPAGAR